jgi:capsular exopolysaccharide synthesis family protein
MNYHRANLPEGAEPKAGSVIPAAQSAPAARDPYASAVGPYYGPGYGPGYGYAEEPSSFQLDVLEYLRILVKRRWLILSIVGAALIFAALTTLMKTPLYTSSVRLQIDPMTVAAKGNDVGSSTPIEDPESNFMRTQFELLGGRTMAQRVASALKLGDDPTFFQPREFSILAFLKGLIRSNKPPTNQGSKKVDYEEAAAGIVLANRAIIPVFGSRLIDIFYSDPDPARAQKVAQGFAEAFVASNIDKRFEANSYSKVFLEDQIAQLKIRLEQSEKALLDFGRKEEIVQTNDKTSIAETNLAAANSALSTLIAERMKNEELWRQLDAAKAINVPQLLTNPVIEGLRAKRSALQTEYQQKLETFQPGYPAMVQLNNQIAEIDRQLAAEVNTLKASYKAAYESSFAQEAEMKKRIEILKQDVLDLQKRSIQYNILKREVDTNQSLYNGLLQRYKEVDVAGGVVANNVFIVDKATFPGGPSSPNMSRALITALALGLALAAGLAWLLERMDDTLRSPEDVERTLGYATLGIIPKVRSDKNLDQELANPRSLLAEAYRSLCTALQLSSDKGLPKTLLVTSAGPGEGKSTTCISLARHFANIGLKVLLLDADLRKPSLHTKLKLGNASGLTNYLTGSASPPEVLQATDLPNLALMASGPAPPNAADLLGSARLHSLLSVGLEVFDLIVVDSPPVMGLADAPLLSSAVSATIFVVGAGQVRKRVIRAAIKRLQFARASLIGTVITRFDPRSSYGYGYGHHYYHGYGHDHGIGDPGQVIAAAETTGRKRLTGAPAEG